MNKIDLEKRLVEFSDTVITLTEKLSGSQKNIHLIEQAGRSCTSSALNYGEAQSAESKKDFIHKISIVMKELRETQINLSILLRINPGLDSDEWHHIIKENNELLAIFHKTIQTPPGKISDNGRWTIFHGK